MPLASRRPAVWRISAEARRPEAWRLQQRASRIKKPGRQTRGWREPGSCRRLARNVPAVAGARRQPPVVGRWRRCACAQHCRPNLGASRRPSAPLHAYNQRQEAAYGREQIDEKRNRQQAADAASKYFHRLHRRPQQVFLKEKLVAGQVGRRQLQFARQTSRTSALLEAASSPPAPHNNCASTWRRRTR